MVTLCCYECTVEFGITDAQDAIFHEEGKTFFCPNGHPQVYSETDLARAQNERDQWRRRYHALKGANTKLRKQMEAHADH